MRMTMFRMLVLAVSALVVGVLTTSEVVAQSQATGGEELFPPNARPGECYARVFVPPTYKTETVKVLKSDATERIETTPARYEWMEERVLVQKPSEKLEVVPATYEWVEERVLVRPASTHTEVVPAVYDTVTERVIDTPAHTVWKKGRGPLERIDHATGEIMCLVEVPATYKTVTKRVLKHSATTRTVEVPPEYKMVKKRLMKTPPTTRAIKVPAKYQTVKVRKLVAPGKTRSVPIPAEYQWVSKQVKVSEGRVAWRSVLCETNTTPRAVESIQKALLRAGYDPGQIDGGHRIPDAQGACSLPACQRATPRRLDARHAQGPWGGDGPLVNDCVDTVRGAWCVS